MALKRDVGILDDCAALSLRKRKSLIANYRKNERTPRILALLAAGSAMAAALLMAAGGQSPLDATGYYALIAALLAVMAALLSISTVMFGSTSQVADSLEGASSFLTLSNRCQIERERAVAAGGALPETLREVIAEFNRLSHRYDRLLPISVGSLSMARATDLPDVVPASVRDPHQEQANAMLNQLDQLIENLDNSDFGEPDDLIDAVKEARKTDGDKPDKGRNKAWGNAWVKSHDTVQGKDRDAPVPTSSLRAQKLSLPSK